MRQHKELELLARKLLDRVLANGSYVQADIAAIRELYFEGRSDVQTTIKDALEIVEPDY